jgi:hypothetical protein
MELLPSLKLAVKGCQSRCDTPVAFDYLRKTATGVSQLRSSLPLWLFVVMSFAVEAAGQSLKPTSVRSLDGQWMLATDPENVGRNNEWWKGPTPGAKETKVPWIIQDAFPAYHGVAWYWREFEAPSNPHKGGRTLLRFWQVDYKADVWLNDQLAGTHEGPEDPFLFDVTDVIRPGTTNRLAVRVLNPTHQPIDGITLDHVPHRNKVIDYKAGHSYNHGGIMDSVELVIAPAVRVNDVFVRADPDSGAVRIQTAIHNATARSVRADLHSTISPAASGATIDAARTEQEFPSGNTVVDTTLQIDKPRLWNLNDPFLYRVSVRVQPAPDPSPPAASAAVSPGVGTNSFDEYSTTCGFRDFRFEDGYFRLNGKRVFLWSSHTGNHCPIGLQLPHDPDLIRRDLINLKTMGFNTVRFSLGVATRDQLDLCDALGLMVWEESYGGWYIRDTPKTAAYFDQSITGMIKRDRNHPSITIWGLLNENFGGPLFYHAAKSLPMIRGLDDTRLVMLNTGRHDRHRPHPELDVGSISNPGSMEWLEAYDNDHPYRRAPHSAEVIQHYRTAGSPDKPFFMSEGGIGSAVDLVRVSKLYEQNGGGHTEDAQFYRGLRDRFLADWKRWKLAGVFGRPEDYFRACVSFMAAQRKHGLNAVRANPHLIGHGVTGGVDQGMSGEGLTTTWREFKPGTVDAVADGLAPLRWCLFAEPVNFYRGSQVKLEAVLANEDALPPGAYPVRLAVFNSGHERMLERKITVAIPDNSIRPEPPFAMPVFAEELIADWPTDRYRFTATFERGGAAAGGEIEFYVSDPADMPTVEAEVVVWGPDPELVVWLKSHGIATKAFDPKVENQRQIIIAGERPPHPDHRTAFKNLARHIGRGSIVIFLSPSVFNKQFDWAGHVDEPLGWLPLITKGKIETGSNPGIYRPDFWTRRHPILSGLPCGGLMDFTFYRDIISDRAYVGMEPPHVAVAGAINTSFDYWAGLSLAIHKLVAGEFILNTLHIRKNLGTDPVAERILRNLLNYAAANTSEPPRPLPKDFDESLAERGI